MVTITLPPDLEQVVTERAKKQGTTPELFLLGELRGHYLQASPIPVTEIREGETMADFFAGYAGTVNSREIVPEGAHLSADTGRKFKELMLQKYKSGQR
jgi:hypothetical protein